MINLPNWLAGLLPTPSNKRVPFEPDSPSLVPFLPKPPPDVAAAIDRQLDRDIAAEIARRRGSNPPAPAPGSKPKPMAYWAGEIDAPAPVTLLLAIRSAIDNEPFGDEPRAVLLAVARWLRLKSCHDAAARL